MNKNKIIFIMSGLLLTAVMEAKGAAFPSQSKHRSLFDVFDIPKENATEKTQSDIVTDKEILFLKNRTHCVQITTGDSYWAGSAFEIFIERGAEKKHTKDFLKLLLKAGPGVKVGFTIGGQEYECSISPKEPRKQGPFSKFMNKRGLDSTSSNHGNIVLVNSVLMDVLDDSIKEGDHILEIGAAKGHQSYKMLSKGAFVTAIEMNEIDLSRAVDDIKDATAKVKIAKIKGASTSKTTDPSVTISLADHFHGIKAKFPNDPALKVLNRAYFDAVLMSHVAHYLTGPELREGIQKIKSWLKPKGRFYFQSLTPYSVPYHVATAIASEKNDREGVLWPGYSEKASFKAAVKGGMPSAGHPISPKIIERELKNAGLKVEMVNYAFLEDPNSKQADKIVNLPVTYEELERFVKQEGAPEELEEIASRFRKHKGPLNRIIDIIEKNDIPAYKYLKALDEFGISHDVMVAHVKNNHPLNERITNHRLYQMAFDHVKNKRECVILSMSVVIAIASKPKGAPESSHQ